MNVVDLNDTTSSLTSAATSTEENTKYTPDELTRERFRNLAIVGKALMETESEYSYQSEYYAAKQALEKFTELYNKLDLDQESRVGFDLLIKYLDKKIDRRLKASLQTSGVS